MTGPRLDKRTRKDQDETNKPLRQLKQLSVLSRPRRRIKGPQPRLRELSLLYLYLRMPADAAGAAMYPVLKVLPLWANAYKPSPCSAKPWVDRRHETCIYIGPGGSCIPSPARLACATLLHLYTWGPAAAITYSRLPLRLSCVFKCAENCLEVT